MKIFTFENHSSVYIPKTIVKDDILIIETCISLSYDHIQFLDCNNNKEINKRAKIFGVSLKIFDKDQILDILKQLSGIVIISQKNIVEDVLKYIKKHENSIVIDYDEINMIEQQDCIIVRKADHYNEANVVEKIETVEEASNDFINQLFDMIKKESDQTPLDKMLKRFNKNID